MHNLSHRVAFLCKSSRSPFTSIGVTLISASLLSFLMFALSSLKVLNACGGLLRKKLMCARTLTKQSSELDNKLLP